MKVYSSGSENSENENCPGSSGDESEYKEIIASKEKEIKRLKKTIDDIKGECQCLQIP